MTKKTAIFLFSLVYFAGFAVSVSAASPFDIEFPVAELGGCADKDACRAYCDDAAHGVSCAEFAQKHGLGGGQKAVQAARAVEQGGPGGCRSEQECRAYCEDSAHETECVEFAVAKGFMTRVEADRALKPGPGGCRGRACQAYCNDPAHENECFEYAAANGLIPKEELRRIREFKEKFKKREVGPGGCQGEQQCRQYCEDPEHITECVSFAEEQGFVDKDQARIIKKTAGKGPGGCKGSDACRQYCEDSSHQTECIDFGEKNGFMTSEEARRARKFAGKTGPGGCQGERCRDFCNQPGNEEQCLEFAEREEIIPKEELARVKKFITASRDGGPGGCRGVQCRDFCQDPAHREECFGFAKKQGLISKEEEKHFEAGAKIEDVVKKSGGPGGCRSDDECRIYCMDPGHVEECVAFGATHGGVAPEQARAMLKQFTERRFEVHGGASEFGPGGFEDFARFEQDAGRRFEEFRALEEQFRGKEFPGFGPPGEGGFPGGPGGFPGGPGGGTFAGPGGCTSPAECIKYCAEHREECFSGGQSGGQDHRQDQDQGFEFEEQHGDAGFSPPRIRGGLIHEFEPDDLPEDFGQMPQEAREQFFKEKMRQNFPGGFPGGASGGFPGHAPDGEFHGAPPRGFPGRAGEFPGGEHGEFPDGAPQSFPGSSKAFPDRSDPSSPHGFGPESGAGFSPSGGFRPPEQSFQQGQESFQPPSGETFRPPEGTFAPPPPGTGVLDQHSPGAIFPPPSGGTFEQQPSGSFSQPPPPSGTFFAPPPPPPPSGFAPLLRSFGAILNAVIPF